MTLSPLFAHMGPVDLDQYGGWFRPMSLSFHVVDGQHVACMLTLNQSGLDLFFARSAGGALKAADKKWALEFLRRSLAIRANGLPCPLEWADDSCNIVREYLNQEELEAMGIEDDDTSSNTRIKKITYTANVRYSLPEHTTKLEIEWLDKSVAKKISYYFENLKFSLENANMDAEQFGVFSTSGKMSVEDLERFGSLAVEMSSTPRILAMLTRGLKTENVYFGEKTWCHTWIEPPPVVAVAAQGVWKQGHDDKHPASAVPRLRLTASSVLFALLALVAALWFGARVHMRAPACALLLLLALAGGRYGKAVLWQPRPVVGTQERNALAALSDSEKLDIFRRLHRNIYNSFLFDTEDDIYTALEQSVGGDLLEHVYTDIYTTMTLRENGQAAVFAVDRISELECTILADPGEGVPPGAFGIFTRWVVDGRVGHWGHVHRRENKYAAKYVLAPVGGFWKIVGTKLLSQERMKDSLSNG